MPANKHWYTSKAIICGIVAVVGAVGDMFINGGANPANITALIGALGAIYGRYVAITEIKGIGTPS